MSRQVCAAPECNEPLPPDAHHNQKYHEERCGWRVARRRQRAKERGKELVDEIKPVNDMDVDSNDRLNPRRGPGYEEFLRAGFGEMLANGWMSNSEVAEAMDVNPGNVTRWLAAYHQDIKRDREKQAWTGPDPEAAEALEDFTVFRDRYFHIKPGQPYITKPFHLRWIEALYDAYDNGTRHMILSPPRHGKTELLIHFAVWLIVKDPDVNILWVGGNENMAQEAVQMIERILETNDQLIDDHTAGGHGFKPSSRTGRSWAASEMTVATRTASTKGATIRALGRGGTIRSLDADLIIADDIEGEKHVRTPSARSTTRNWWNTDLASRKMHHTGWVYIASRIDPDDLAGHLIDSDEWVTHVERAHDPVCDIDDTDVDHTSCVLFPELNPHEYLISQRNTIGRDRFQLMYQNDPQAGAGAIFVKEHIADCRNGKRTIGSHPPGLPLVAGLDPATRGHQAAALLAYDPNTKVRYLVDIDDTEAGGLEGARRVIESWHNRYKVTRWIIERNNYQDAILHDVEIQRLKADRGIMLQPHFTTGQNKWDDNLGVTILARQFEQGLYDLPYADLEAKQKVDSYIRQLVTFDGKQRGRSDQVMAAWFAEVGIQRWYVRDESGDDNVVKVNFGGYTPTMMEPSRYVPSIFGRP